MRIGYDDADSLLTYPHANNLSVHGQPIRIRGRAHDRPQHRPSTPLSCTVGTHTKRRAHHTRRAPHTSPAHTKRARTNRSGRATYSAQALGRLPWFAPFLRRSRRLRPRFDMSFSLGLLSRLKHFCTHWPKPPRHRPFAATKVTEKRAATPASSARAPRRDHASSQRS